MRRFIARLRIGLIVSLLLLCENPAMAADDPEDLSDAKEDSSEFEEEETDVSYGPIASESITAEAGIGFRRAIGPLLQINWFKSDETILGLRLSQFNAQDQSGFDRWDLTSAGLVSRFHSSSSFFIEGGLDMSHQAFEIKKADFDNRGSIGDYTFDGKTRQVSITLSFGNLWAYDDWIVGINWLEVFLPFVSSFRSSSSSPLGEVNDQERSDERKMRTETWKVNFGLSLRGGWVF